MHDPNDIAMTSADVDLSVYQDAAGDGGANDWADYANTVSVWGADTTDSVLSDGVRTAGAPSCGTGTRSLYHPSKRMATPFVIASVVAILILIVVFFPE
jgi:hypothetical protein